MTNGGQGARMASGEVANAINALSEFCGRRDVGALTPAALRQARGWDRADVVMFFGASILAGAETMATAIRNGVASTTMLVGGEGHTTAWLRRAAAARLHTGDLSGATESEIFERYLRDVHHLSVDLLERASTNCGSNITNALAVLEERGIRHDRVILIQDATMQRRMNAGLQRARPTTDVVGHAAYTARVGVVDGVLAYSEAPEGMWPIDRFASMLLGEVARLRDDEHGYGPRGRGWIAHVEVPPEVEAASELLSRGGFAVRTADDRWASPS